MYYVICQVFGLLSLIAILTIYVKLQGHFKAMVRETYAFNTVGLRYTSNKCGKQIFPVCFLPIGLLVGGFKTSRWVFASVILLATDQFCRLVLIGH